MRRTARLRSRFLYRVKKMAKLTAATKGIELISGLNTFFSLIVYTVDHFDVKLALIKRIVNCVFQFLPILPRY
jgi:hypothetical protein